MCKSITHFPTQRGGSSLGSLARQWSRTVLLSTDCPSWHIIIHGNRASHSSNGDIMELVKTSPLSQQDRRQHRMEAWLTGPKADAFCFLIAPGGGWWHLSPTSSSSTGLILTAHFNNTLISSHELAFTIFWEWICEEKKKKHHKARICGWPAVHLAL